MTREQQRPAWRHVLASVRQLFDRLRNRRERPPPAGVREPRRPRPTLPAAAVALKEPRADTARRIRLLNWRREDRD